MELEDALRRIKKCLALSSSANENEAASALRQAQKLMEQHGLTMDAVHGAEVGEQGAVTEAWQRPADWEQELANMVKRAFGCALYVHRGRTGDFYTEWRFIGLKHHAAMAAYTYQVLSRHALKARKAYTKTLGDWYSRSEKTTMAASFTRGFIANVERQVHSLALPPEQVAAIEKRLETTLGPNPGKVKATQRDFNWNAFDAGKNAGEAINLHRPMDGKEEQLKLER